MDNDRQRFQLEGLRWLQEMELINHPQLINTLKLNALSVSKHIQNVEFLIHREKKACLVLVHLNWFGRTFKKESILSEALETLATFLPSFRFRVTDDQALMDLAVANVKKVLRGKNTNEKLNNLNPDRDLLTASTDYSSATVPDLPESTQGASVEADNQEQPSPGVELRSEASGSDSSKKPGT
jgi:hypothetical protein